VALQNLISNDYMAVNFENRVSSKEIEIATAWDAMNVDEIHARVFGASAIASGFISAQGKKTDGARFTAKVRFLAVLVKQNGQWQLGGHAIVACEGSAAQPEWRRGGERLFSTGSVVRRGIENRQSRFRDLRWR
jgi:hypothetical protein